jgi:predicted DCC family thiol-disulfide oxidoreductase YuxK
MASEKIIIYDDSCPLCCWYTDAFVNTGLLSKDGRLSFSQLPNKGLLQNLDMERSKDEIPLVDSAGGPTLYGIDSLLEILGKRWPWMKIVANISPINWFLRRLYKLVSYNRRIIVASDPSQTSGFDCSPHFNLFYRYLYLLLAMLVGGGSIVTYLLLYFPPTVMWIVGISIFLLLTAKIKRPLVDVIEYWGIMLTPFLLIGLLLLPAIIWPVLKLVFGLPAVLIGSKMLWRRWKISRRVD